VEYRVNRAVAIMALAMLSSFSLAAQTVVPGLLPKDARSMGMGGSFKVFAEGYSSLWGNPAGLAARGSLTVADSATWAYVQPTPLNIKNIIRVLGQQATHDESVATLDGLINENDFGMGESLGFGWTGNGLGLGLTSIVDALVTGDALAGSKLAITSQTNAVLGMAWPVNLGPFGIRIGASARGFYRIETLPGGWPFDSLAEAALNRQDLYSIIKVYNVQGGFGIAIDAGATFSIGPFSIGLMMRDYGDKFAMNESTIEDIANSFMVPSGGIDTYVFKPVYTAGLALKLYQDFLFSPSFYVEADDPLALFPLVTRDIDAMFSRLHIGVDLKFLKFISLRAGFNQGLFSFGAGLDLIILEVDAALFSEPISAAGGRIGRTGIALQGAIRF
jgi:hypothetical protein